MPASLFARETMPPELYLRTALLPLAHATVEAGEERRAEPLDDLFADDELPRRQHRWDGVPEPVPGMTPPVDRPSPKTDCNEP